MHHCMNHIIIYKQHQDHCIINIITIYQINTDSICTSVTYSCRTLINVLVITDNKMTSGHHNIASLHTKCNNVLFHYHIPSNLMTWIVPTIHVRLAVPYGAAQSTSAPIAKSPYRSIWRMMHIHKTKRDTLIILPVTGLSLWRLISDLVG
jgi:hypothetical protein